ncbi:tRNA 2-selenouridine(34) synthase MnmH [Desulforamulus aquiferis]|uniref:tRNA 2-selenouridine(34) synthase MnmH n=1 Tax=Desulforamulus aquiferis TaxID=1397668 RepID=A0AAW7ZDX0_9FIRM|nr:tRNA 2-selenouridine(34) synthase MnmH [Desulforamulus aquiferis]MDO7787465.1 tRNA 2-selenouridine(34) synthase MnmH [Desulforamulus aquiferis]RYD05426.1 hypothetical protein N752_08765 [Desulforamulus aquiferis]
MLKDIPIIEALKLENACLIDLRSEGEFEDGSIPGAVNIPLFNNEERAKVGTVYKQIGTAEAKALGLEIAGPKGPKLFQQISNLANEKKVLLFCWRGGMRSKYTWAVMNSLGLDVCRIQGGYKAYRRYVHGYLDREAIPHKSIVLCGLTGVGKTLVLNRLADMGLPILDLEHIARHRGSAYGKIGLPPSPSQKDFEAEAVKALVSAEAAGVVFVECESRRVGKLIVPASVMNSMGGGYKILLYTDLHTRVQRIIDEYTVGPDSNIEELQKCTSMLRKSLGTNKVEELNEKLAQRNFEEVFSFLLSSYYDPLYKYPDKPSDSYSLSVDCTNIEECSMRIAEWVKTLPEYGVPL